MRFDADVEMQGPIYRTAYAERVTDDMADDIEQAIAKDARMLVVQHLDRVMREPTGYYLDHVRVKRDGDGYAVHDSGVVYGPWLEGTGSMNFPNTRFKGYSAFRRAAMLMVRRSGQIAERVVRRNLRRLQ